MRLLEDPPLRSSRSPRSRAQYELRNTFHQLPVTVSSPSLYLAEFINWPPSVQVGPPLPASFNITSSPQYHFQPCDDDHRQPHKYTSGVAIIAPRFVFLFHSCCIARVVQRVDHGRWVRLPEEKNGRLLGRLFGGVRATATYNGEALAGTAILDKWV